MAPSTGPWGSVLSLSKRLPKTRLQALWQSHPHPELNEAERGREAAARPLGQNWTQSQGQSRGGLRGLLAAGRSGLAPGEDGKSRDGACPHRAIYSHRSWVTCPVPGGSGSARWESHQSGRRELSGARPEVVRALQGGARVRSFLGAQRRRPSPPKATDVCSHTQKDIQ